MYSFGDPVIPSEEEGIGDPSRQRLFIVQVKLPLLCKGSPEKFHGEYKSQERSRQLEGVECGIDPFAYMGSEIFVVQDVSCS